MRFYSKDLPLYTVAPRRKIMLLTKGQNAALPPFLLKSCCSAQFKYTLVNKALSLPSSCSGIQPQDMALPHSSFHTIPFPPYFWDPRWLGWRWLGVNLVLSFSYHTGTLTASETVYSRESSWFPLIPLHISTCQTKESWLHLGLLPKNTPSPQLPAAEGIRILKNSPELFPKLNTHL